MEEMASKICLQCANTIPGDARFCKFCGALQPHDEYDTDETSRNKWLRLLAAFYAIDLVICTVVNFVEYFRGLAWLLFTQSILGGLTLIFLFFIWKDIRPLLSWKKFTPAKALVYSMAAILLAIVVNLIVKWLNKSIFDQDVYFYRSFGHLQYPKISMIVLIAMLPALFEELGYRGIILQSLLNIVDERQAIFVSAFLFAVIHMSFISFFWLVPFAIWLGNIRLKEGTIWYGVLVHFCFNMTACLFEFFELQVF